MRQFSRGWKWTSRSPAVSWHRCSEASCTPRLPQRFFSRNARRHSESSRRWCFYAFDHSLSARIGLFHRFFSCVPVNKPRVTSLPPCFVFFLCSQSSLSSDRVSCRQTPHMGHCSRYFPCACLFFFKKKKLFARKARARNSAQKLFPSPLLQIKNQQASKQAVHQKMLKHPHQTLTRQTREDA